MSPIAAINKHLQMAQDGGRTAIFAGEIRSDARGRVTPFDRASAAAHLVRNDGAWLHFTLTVRADAESLSLEAYSFEIVFPNAHHPAFLRFDLNSPGHENDEREMRSHFHPGNDDLQSPSAMMTPEEILDLLIWGLRPRNQEAARAR
jgi:hypothetical protein